MASGKAFPLSLIVKAVDQATAPIRKVSKEIGGLAAVTGRAGAALSLAVTAPLVGLGVASVAAFGKFEAGMASVSTLIDTNVESLDAMGKQVLAISRRTPVAIGDLTEALYEARSAGVSAADQFKVLEGSARLAVAGLGTTKEAVDLVTSSINAFGLQGAESARVYDLIFKATNTGKTTISQLAQGFGGVAGTVANAGVKIDEYLASVAALTTTGLPASEAHTQLRAVIAGLTRQTTLTSAVFKRLGAKDLKEVIAKSGGLVPALEKIKGVLKGNDTAMLQLLGSTEALNAVIGLTGKQGAAFTTTLDAMRNGANQLDGAFAKQNRTSVATMQRLRNSIEGIAISVGRILVPALEHLAPMLERLADSWESLGSGTQRTLVVIAGTAAVVGPAATALSGLAKAYALVNAAVVFTAGWGKYLWMMRASIMASLVPSLTAATASVWGFTAALLANPITWVVIAVGALAAAAYQVYKNWEPLKQFFSELFSDPFEVFWRNWAQLKEELGGLASLYTKVAGYTPLGFVAQKIFGDDDAPAPTLGAARAAPPPAAQRSEARVQVDFANLPRGARVTPASSNTAELDLSMGYSMVGG